MSFDVRQYLAELFAASVVAGPTDPASPICRVAGPGDLSAEWRCEFEERAALREYDGGQAREHAEAEALTEILARMQAAERCARTRDRS